MLTMAQLNESERAFPPLLLLLPFSIIIIIIIFKLFLKPSKPLQLPPGPTPWPLLGNIFHMGRMPHRTLTSFANTYGPLISLKLGTQHLVVGSSPSAASEILKTHDRVLSGRHVPSAFPTQTSQLDHTSIGWTSECHEGWRSLRALCRAEMFCSRALESQALLREKKAGEMVGFLRSKVGGSEEEAVDVGEMVFATVLNMLSNVMLSRDVISFEGGVMKGFIRSVMEVASAPNLSDFYPFLQRLDLQGLRKRALGLGMRIRSMWEPIIEERREIRCSSGGSSQQDFLDTLLDNGFSNERIHQLFMELFAAGTDTSTSTIEWAMAELIKNPESMEKVCKELKREINGEIRESHLVQLPYLQACVKETLRLHPPAPLLLPHRAIEACQVMDYTIPKGAQILINVWAVQRDASIWDEPLKFRPERFLETGLDFKGNDFEFLPFGAGRRICPGLPMAAKTVPLVLASMIHSFDWSLPDGKNPKDLNMNEKFGVTLQKEQPLFLIPKTR